MRSEQIHKFSVGNINLIEEIDRQVAPDEPPYPAAGQMKESQPKPKSPPTDRPSFGREERERERDDSH